MKYILNKYVFFILIFIAIFLFDFIVFQMLFFPFLVGRAGNVAFVMILLASFFIIIPFGVSYYILIKRQQKIAVAQEKLVARRRRIKITLTLVLVVFLFIAFKNLTQKRVDPYIFHPITDQEFVKPLMILTSRQIGENEYYLKEAKNHGISLYQKIGSNQKDDKFIFDLPSLIDSQSVSNFWFDNMTNTILVVTVKTTNAKDRYEQIFKYTLNPEEDPLQLLRTASLGLYEGNARILDYFFDTKTLLLESGGGDGCGGWGSIWILKENISKTLQEYSIGCHQVEKPRFAGYDGSFLYFAVFDTGESKQPGDNGIIGLKEIFKINPRTKKRIKISNLSLPKDVTYVNLSTDKKDMILRVDQNKVFILDLQQPYSIKEASSSAGN